MSSSDAHSSNASISNEIFPHHDVKHFVSKEHYHNEFSSKISPVVTVQQGELVHVETNDCFHGKISPSGDTTDGVVASTLLSNIPVSQRNPVTGPIFVEDAEPGDILAVKILDIRPNTIGVACCGSSSGQLCHLLQKTNTAAAIRFFDVTRNAVCQDVNDESSESGGTFEGTVTMREAVTGKSGTSESNNHLHPRLGPISFPASPMLGVIGVAPEGDKPILTMPAGKHGGNLDNRANGIGSTIYIKVNHLGALLSIGDMHASQGDGEISGTGVEIGGHVLLKCRVLKRDCLYPTKPINREETNESNNITQSENSSNNNQDEILSPILEYPLTETATHWITHGVVVENIPQATNVACEEAAKILVHQWGFSIEEAFIFLSTTANLGLCQACHPDVGTQIAKMSVPKLPGVCPRPFRMLHDEDW